MGELFGTDGVRGIPGKPPLTAPMIRGIAALAAKLLLERGRRHINGSGPVIVIGRDTRGSGPEVTRHLTAGFLDAGARALDGVPHAAVPLTPRLHALEGPPAITRGVQRDQIFDALGLR